MRDGEYVFPPDVAHVYADVFRGHDFEKIGIYRHVEFSRRLVLKRFDSLTKEAQERAKTLTLPQLEKTLELMAKYGMNKKMKAEDKPR